ncbi:unnamed protein product [Rotaria magnacalcarata]|uniref:Uncharacterized protein n=1 Tax=Rotaria magnacalcarata TaxID=392030 RepID=A0A820CGX5_9BILA|nr:unnamed protein product [Rotaria magnacalcarata]
MIPPIHLKSLVLKEISTFKLAIPLFYLKPLCCLFSLTICLDQCFDDFGDIYQIIFRLPFLKYAKLIISKYEELDINIPIATNKQYSTIEYLVIHHRCSLNELTVILSRTPQLSHLYCLNISRSDEIIEQEVSTILPNLVHFSLSLNYIEFDEFKELIIQISSRLKLLSVTIKCVDKSYLDASLWEKLILEHTPDLSRFIFCYADAINDDFEMSPCHASIDRFTSSFLVQRQWNFRIIVADDEVIYVIRPYEATSVNCPKYTHINAYSNQNTINDGVIDNRQKDANSSVSYSSIVSLFVRDSPLVYYQNLDSVRISSFPLYEDFYESDQPSIISKFLLKNNKITKVALKSISQVEEIGPIIDICPRMQHLILEFISHANLKLLVRRTLSKIKTHRIRRPITICIYVADANNNIVQELQKMIHSKKLLKHYTLNRQYDRFYLHWHKG